MKVLMMHMKMVNGEIKTVAMVVDDEVESVIVAVNPEAEYESSEETVLMLRNGDI